MTDPTPLDCQSSHSTADPTAAESDDWQSSEPRAADGDEDVVDARGLRCPLPVIRLGAALRDRPAGAEVVLLATDPAARSDVAAFCRMRGHELVGTEDRRPHGEAAYTAYRVRKSA